MGAKVIAIANQKGGVGKTTTTLSLGAALSRKGLRVLIIDLDPHACASVHLRFYPEELDATVHDLFMAEPAAYGELWKRIVRRNEGQDWDVVAASIRLSELEVDLKNRKGKGAILQDAVSLVRDRYDYILLDCPPHVGILLVNALVAADLLVIPIQTDFLALHGLKLLFDTIRVLNKVLPQPVRYMALATMYDRRAKACTRVLELLGRKLGPRMFASVIGVDTRFREASAQGRVIYDIDPASRGAKGYEQLADEVTALW
ncbi:MAG TPA: ParA family protein [Desulfovibrio sp.]|jgi:chromosome partitioning protein|uniref:ParA family protein n=1 Tax=Nitratidesulfovibrio vulgaris TaxID=881 RepID=UPI000E920971|nr:ParA family protein [Nitratidesulfovibrio vulgaris]WCB45599.1 ParA family protein [Nitratidesulfovibrio vulgaris]GEB80430.1 chromosome partitioning protein ParA [Desulfovibrio desulfuricans]HBW15322.1 ParA family protein [Desulfovibrio sp.]